MQGDIKKTSMLTLSMMSGNNYLKSGLFLKNSSILSV